VVIWTVLFWLSLGFLLYAYAGLGLLTWVMSKLAPHPVRKAPITPHLSVIVAAYNEEKSIRRRLQNLLQSDYPEDRLQIIVASDGSSDATMDIAKEYTSRGVTVLNLPRQGKIFAIHQAVSHATGEILIFTDANTRFHLSALRRLAANFFDVKVGGVCGNQIYTKGEQADATSDGESLYWSYDKWLKSVESLTGSIVSADGAIYAIRTSLYEFPGSTAVTDDFALSTAVLEKGYRLVYEPEAIAYEYTAEAAELEFGRKVRIMNRGLRGVWMRRRLLNPMVFGYYSVILFSHKLLRRLLAFFLIGLFISNLIVASHGSFYLACAAGQVTFYLLAWMGYLARKFKLGKIKFLNIPFYYCLANGAAMMAVINILGGQRIERWQPKRSSN
jgi:cellulose synthase/poly-beta-1,6-N-acetylglucosamine synthase-like glycosyltransferase